MKLILSFILGSMFAWVWMKSYDDSVFQLWTEAYQVGKDDGYVLGRSDITFEDFTFEQLEAKCMFLYQDHRRKGDR